MNNKLTNTALSSIKSVSTNTNNLNASATVAPTPNHTLSSSTTSSGGGGGGGSSSRQLSTRELLEYEEAFKFFDKDHDGYVETSELGRLMRSVGLYPSESEIQQIQKSRPSCKFDLAEFVGIVASATSTLADANINEQQMREAFRMFDAYGNGFVNLMQMRNALQNLGEKLRDDELDELIREADIDAEGNVSYNELVKILCRS